MEQRIFIAKKYYETKNYKQVETNLKQIQNVYHQIKPQLEQMF